MKKRFNVKINITGILLVLIIILAIALSFFMNAGLSWLICWAFGWAWSWKIGFGFFIAGCFLSAWVGGASKQ